MADDEDIDDDAVAEEWAAMAEEGADPDADAAPAKAGMKFEDVKHDSSSSDDDDDEKIHTAQELEPVFDVPVNVQAVLGKSYLEVSQLLKLGPGAVVELDRKVGEAIDIYVNDRLVARGEVVLLDDNLGVTMTEIIKGDRL